MSGNLEIVSDLLRFKGVTGREDVVPVSDGEMEFMLVSHTTGEPRVLVKLFYWKTYNPGAPGQYKQSKLLTASCKFTDPLFTDIISRRYHAVVSRRVKDGGKRGSRHSEPAPPQELRPGAFRAARERALRIAGDDGQKLQLLCRADQRIANGFTGPLDVDLDGALRVAVRQLAESGHPVLLATAKVQNQPPLADQPSVTGRRLVVESLAAVTLGVVAIGLLLGPGLSRASAWADEPPLTAVISEGFVGEVTTRKVIVENEWGDQYVVKRETRPIQIPSRAITCDPDSTSTWSMLLMSQECADAYKEQRGVSLLDRAVPSMVVLFAIAVLLWMTSALRDRYRQLRRSAG